MNKNLILSAIALFLVACEPTETPKVEPENPQPDKNDSTCVVTADENAGGTVTLLCNGEVVATPFETKIGTKLVVRLIPDDEHILVGSNIAQGCAARDSFVVKTDTTIRPVFEKITPAEISATHKICNYNIRYYNGSSDNANTGNRAWTVRKEKVFEMIRKHTMDICGIEEITKNQSPDFVNELDEYEYIGYGRDNGKENSAGGSGEQTGIIYRKARYVKLDQGRFFLSNTPDRASKSFGSSFNRMVTWVKLKERNGTNEFVMFATHFDHPTTQAGINTRASQADVAINIVPQIADDLPLFFVGDFNCEPTEPAYEKLQNVWTDAFVAIGENAQGGYVCNAEQETAFAEACSETGNTYTGLYSSSDKEPKRIDYVLFDSDKTQISHYTADNDNLGLDAYPSDHLPVITEMEFK